MKKILVAVLAGVVAYAWGMVSWMALPFHNQTLHGFNNEPVVAAALKANASQEGIYLVPYCDKNAPGLTKEEKEATLYKHQTLMAAGPYAFVNIIPGGLNFNMGQAMGLGLLKDIVTAFLLIFILGCTSNLSFWQKTFFVVVAVLAGTVVSLAPLSIWWKFPNDFILLSFIDNVVAWFLAGMVIAKLIK